MSISLLATVVSSPVTFMLYVLCLGGTAFSATSAVILRKTRALALAWVSVFLISFSRCLSCLWSVVDKLKPFEIVK